MKEYTAKSGLTQFMPSMEEVEEMAMYGEGFCLSCGQTQPAEPDARKYRCDCCDNHKVYGAAELVLMGLVH